ncbi:MAG: redoxin domain-containing protein [Planctomycetes bacterium]|nr:redoxin domain-containing protein [Planctomycetota bacterium]
MGFSVLLALLGTLLVFGGAFLLLPVAPELPVLSAGDFPRYVMIGLGMGWSLLGTLQVFRLGRGKAAKVLLGLLLVFTQVAGAGAIWWAADYSFRLPAAIETPAGTPMPTFELKDTQGKLVSSESFRGKRVVLVFFRGPW